MAIEQQLGHSEAFWGQDWGRCVGRGLVTHSVAAASPLRTSLSLRDFVGLRPSKREAEHCFQQGVPDSDVGLQAERTASVYEICRLLGRSVLHFSL